MTKGNKRNKKKENRKNTEQEKRFTDGDAANLSGVKKESNYISYLKKDDVQEIRNLLSSEVLDDCDLLLGSVAIGNFSVVKRLLKHGCQINSRGKNDWTCLMWAVKCKRLEMIDLLIKRSADISATNAEGDNAMLLAIQSDAWHQDAFLDLCNTISRFTTTFREVVNHANKKGYTLLHFSVKRKWNNIVDRLIEDGADVDCIDYRGITPLMIAGYCGDISLIKRLLRSRANVLLEDKRGCTAVCYAIAFMLPKHVEISQTSDNKLPEEFSIFKSMMLSEQTYLKRKLDLLVYPPIADFASTIRKCFIPLVTYFVRFNKNGLLLLMELQVFERIQEAIDRHIEDVEYVKALMSVTLELARDCQCCFNEFLPAEVGKIFMRAGLPETCLRILAKHDQSMKESIIKAALLPLISVSTSRALSGKIWLQSNYKTLTPFFQNCNISKDKSFKILADDFHKNLLRQNVRDFGKMLKNLESGKLIVQSMEIGKFEEHLSKNGSDGNRSTISNSRSVSPSFTDFPSEKFSPQMFATKRANSIEPSILPKHEEIKQSLQQNIIKCSSNNTEGYTNLTELFMSRKNSDNKKTQLLQKPATKACLDEEVEALKSQYRSLENIGMKLDDSENNVDRSHKLINDNQILKSRIEDGKTFSSVLQQKTKTETYSKYFITNSNQNIAPALLTKHILEKHGNYLENCTENTVTSAAVSESRQTIIDNLKPNSIIEANCVKDFEGRYKNPISNFLWSLDVVNDNPMTEKTNIFKCGETWESNIPASDYRHSFNKCYVENEDHKAPVKAEVETNSNVESDDNIVQFDSKTNYTVYYDEKDSILRQEKSKFESDLTAFKDNISNNYLNDDKIEYTGRVKSPEIKHHYKNNDPTKTNRPSEKVFSFELNPPLFKNNKYDIDFSDDDQKIGIYNDADYYNFDYERDAEMNDVCDDGGMFRVVDDNNFLNNQYQNYETEVIEYDSFNIKNMQSSNLDTVLMNNSNRNHEVNYCVNEKENSELDVVEHELSKAAEGKIEREKCSSLNELDTQIEKLYKQVNHIINQYETLCKKDFENGYPKFQGDEARLLELMTSLPLVELSHLQNMKQKWNELREKLTTRSEQMLEGVAEKVEKYLDNFSKSLDKRIDECTISNELELSDIGEDLKYSKLFCGDEKYRSKSTEDRITNNDDGKVVIQIDESQFLCENYRSDNNYWCSNYNKELNCFRNYEENKNIDDYYYHYSQFKQTGFFQQPRRTIVKNEDIYDKGDFNRISHPKLTPKFDRIIENTFLREERPDCERQLIEERKSMYCSQNYLDLILNLMNLNEKKKEIFGNGSLILAASSTFPEYKLRNGGNFGTVELGMDREGYPLAVKKIIRCKTKCMEMITCTLRSLLYEMRDLHHANIVPYVNYVETEFNVMIAMPLCEKNLDEYIEELKECNELANRSLDLVQQMMKGLQYLHSCTPSIIHGNLKPTNILIDSKQLVRLADFGLHKMVCTLQSDIQVAGIVMHYILTGGIHPFGRASPIFILDDPSILVPTLHTTNCEANDLLTWMLEDVNSRPNIDQILSHIFFWSEERKWEFILACSGVDTNYEASHLPLQQFFNFINQRTLKDKSDGNWGTIIEQNFPEHYLNVSRKCDVETVSGY
ncbi:uncharacterized protein LOC111061653 isoform X2 [Nilaparvata lugens]|uniref:uncharacterized protein LOC111061653 isoform X2 n=1 Tax=Nilaparvata lugens TaxID=108931 RepID=UPI00193CA1C4|nr:uncharacterized protein LOC111061653 isoform X2 [Nilaparvata lugens]